MMMSVISDEQSDMQTKFKDMAVRYDKWAKIIVDNIQLKMQRQKKSAQVRCTHVGVDVSCTKKTEEEDKGNSDDWIEWGVARCD